MNKVVIILDDGVVRDVIANQEASVTILDSDVEGIEDNETQYVLGEQFYLYEGIKEATKDISLIEAVYEKTKRDKQVLMDTKKTLYDELSRVITDHEEGIGSKVELYNMLVKIQNRWEDTITSVD